MKGDINPAQAQRKKEKEKQIKRQRQERQSQRNERLAKRNPTRQLKQIAELESRPDTLSSAEQEQLASLKKDIEEISNARKKVGMEEVKTITIDPMERKKKSYYWDPVLNPEGTPPEGEEQAYITDEEDSGYSTSGSVSEIPMPKIPPPSDAELMAGPSQSTYESAPVIKDLMKESSAMVPSVIARNKRKPVPVPVPVPVPAPVQIAQQPMTEEYASEEEEYRNTKWRAVQLESEDEEEL